MRTICYWNTNHQVCSTSYDWMFSLLCRFVVFCIENNTCIILSAGGLLETSTKFDIYICIIGSDYDKAGVWQKQELLTLRQYLGLFSVFGGVRAFHLVSFMWPVCFVLCVFGLCLVSNIALFSQYLLIAHSCYPFDFSDKNV